MLRTVASYFMIYCYVSLHYVILVILHAIGGYIMGISYNIKQARIAAGMTQQQVADIVGVKRATVQAWESGRNNIGAAELSTFAKAIGADVNDLLGTTPTDNKAETPHDELVEMINLLDTKDRETVNSIVIALLNKDKFQHLQKNG